MKSRMNTRQRISSGASCVAAVIGDAEDAEDAEDASDEVQVDPSMEPVASR